MINLIALVFIENAFFQWLFDIAPKAAVAGAVMWILLRWAVKYGKFESRMEVFEARFVRIESDIEALKVDVKEIRIELHSMKQDVNARLGKLEGQMEVVIDLLKNKK